MPEKTLPPEIAAIVHQHAARGCAADLREAVQRAREAMERHQNRVGRTPIIRPENLPDRE